MEMAMIGTMIAGTALTAYSQIQQGRAQHQAAKFEARQMEDQAKEVTAAGQHAALARRRESEVLQSRALAVAGASGAGVLDGDVLRIIGGLQEEGDRAVQTELYNVGSQAAVLRRQAGATRMMGRQARTAGMVGAGATALTGLARTGMAAHSYFGNDAADSEIPIPGRKPMRPQ
jgi:hypothetical protein